MPFVYVITNSTNGMQYVGQTTQSLAARWRQHRLDNGGCRRIHNAIKKYGHEKFTVDTIEECSREALNEREMFWIQELDTLSPNGYNLKAGGGVPVLCKESREMISASVKALWADPEYKKKMVDAHTGLKQLPEHVAKRVQSNTGKKRTAETRAKMSASQMGHTVSVEARARQSFSHTGYRHTDEAKRQIAEAGRGRIDSAETRAKKSEWHSKPVRCVETGEVFSSALVAGEAMGISGSGISTVIAGRQKTAAGLRWEYAYSKEGVR